MLFAISAPDPIPMDLVLTVGPCSGANHRDIPRFSDEFSTAGAHSRPGEA